MMGQADSRMTCPVCGGLLRVSGQRYALQQIFDLWRPVLFTEQVLAEHVAQASETQLFVCQECELEIFLPQIIGTPRFYVEAYNLDAGQLASEFTYSASKWDFDEALKDMVGCKTLLEVGCGPGHFLQRARQVVPRVYGVEYNEVAAREARAKGLRVFTDPEHVQADGAVDAVFCFHVLEHVADPVEFLARLTSLVRPGGRIGVSVPNQAGPLRFLDACAMNMPPHHATRWKLHTLRALARRIGVQVERVAYEPLLLENHSYYSVSWVQRVLPGTSSLKSLLRHLVSIALRSAFRLLRVIGLRYLPPLRGQSIYVLMLRPPLDGVR
jgi:SAM-dependent methyltransferase